MRVEPKKNLLFTKEGEIQEKYEVVDNHNDELDLAQDDDYYYSYWDDSNENDD